MLYFLWDRHYEIIGKSTDKDDKVNTENNMRFISYRRMWKIPAVKQKKRRNR